MTKIIALRIEVPADDAVTVEAAKAHIRALLRTQGSVVMPDDTERKNLTGDPPLVFFGAVDVKQGVLPEGGRKRAARRGNGDVA